jgi:hypothetical protein
MTTWDDTDRRIAAMVGEAEVRLPERTIEAVLAHARSHPRRRDPLAALRPDPMRRRSGVGALFAPVPLVAVVGLLIAAALAGAAVGGLFDRGPSVVPPIVTPSPSVSAPPTSGPKPVVLDVDLVEVEGQDAAIHIVDASMTLESAASGQPAFGGSVAGDTIDVSADADDPNVLILTWTGLPCDTTHDLSIDADGRTMRLTRPRCEGDTTPRDLVLRLRFAAPVPPAEVKATIATE